MLTFIDKFDYKFKRKIPFSKNETVFFWNAGNKKNAKWFRKQEIIHVKKQLNCCFFTAAHMCQHGSGPQTKLVKTRVISPVVDIISTYILYPPVIKLYQRNYHM